jgi:hypothetical protein
MAEPTTLQLTPMRAVQPDGKDYWRVEFEEDFDLQGDGGSYHGNQAMVWKQDASKIDALLAVKGKLCEVIISPSAKNADWAGTLERCGTVDTGDIVFEKAKGGGGGGGGWKGGSKGPGNWETSQERLFKNLSIESQGSLGRLVELAKTFVYIDADDGPSFKAVAFHQAVEAIVADHQKFASSTRSQAERTEGGKPADALKGAPANPKPDLPTAPRPGHEQVVEPVGGVYQLGDDGSAPTVRDQALKRYNGSVALLKQKYDTVFPDTAGKSFKDMTDFELACLVED